MSTTPSNVANNAVSRSATAHCAVGNSEGSAEGNWVAATGDSVGENVTEGDAVGTAVIVGDAVGPGEELGAGETVGT